MFINYKCKEFKKSKCFKIFSQYMEVESNDPDNISFN